MQSRIFDRCLQPSKASIKKVVLLEDLSRTPLVLYPAYTSSANDVLIISGRTVSFRQNSVFRRFGGDGRFVCQLSWELFLGKCFCSLRGDLVYM